MSAINNVAACAEPMTSEAKYRPILFSGPMVRALRNGTKTQTRRVVKLTANGYAKEPGRNRRWHPEDPQVRLASPYGQPGDRLWVRETWIWHGSMHGGSGPIEIYLTYTADGQRVTIPARGDEKFPEQPPRRDGEVYSLRDAPADFHYTGENTYIDRLTRWWRRKIPAIHMPRWASRITLEITAVRVERLQDISEADAIAEGIETNAAWPGGFFRNYAMDDERDVRCLPPIESYRSLWERINGPGSWSANPWVWVVEFKVVTP